MRILYCIPNLYYGGAERQLSYVAARLSEMGHEIHVASSRGGVNLDRLTANGVEWHCLGGLSNFDPMILFRLVALIKRLKPDVLQTILTPMDMMGGAAALLTRTRWILKESSSGLLYASGLRNKLRPFLGRLADAVISNSAGGDEYWRSAGASVRYIIPNSVPLDEIECLASGSANSGGGEYSGVAAASGFKLILFAGRMDAGKNVETLVAALSEIADEVPFVALLCGDGPQRAKLETMVENLGLRQRILFPGYVSNLWSLMNQSDLFVSLSRFEGCPNVVLEAAACGSPLVLSDIPAHRELFNESSALFVSPDDPAKVAGALKQILTGDDAATRERAQFARARIAGMLIGKTTQRYADIYQSLMQQ